MAKDIKLYKDGNEITINETQLDNFLDLGWKHNNGFKIGMSVKHDDEYTMLTNLGFNKSTIQPFENIDLAFMGGYY